ncbi:SET domain-containing protein [Hypoxylon sp. NC1633]|nr:SET domain-containing protein [Hypoxylon sp. NC1633]
MRATSVGSFVALSGIAVGALALSEICPRSPLQGIEDQICAGPKWGLSATRKGDGDSSLPHLPWKGPEHCVNETCIFSNQHVGDGIVLFTSERDAHIASNFPVMASSTAATLPFHTAEIAGKGIGVVADRKIRKGETILVRSPTIMVQTEAHVGMEPGTRDVLYDLAVDRLPSKGRQLFMGQMGRDVFDKIEMNCFQLYIDGANESGGHLGCYPEISRFNHDCRPNVHNRINNMTHTTVAARDIELGEELSISYIDVILPREERRSRLRGWGFECACSHCRMSDEEAAASDARLRRIKQLESALVNFNETVVTAETGAQLVDLYERERLDIHLGRVYTRAALNFALFGEEDKAREFARVAVEAVERESGPDAGDAKAMRILAENPRAHWTWGKRRKGRAGQTGKGK